MSRHRATPIVYTLTQSQRAQLAAIVGALTVITGLGGALLGAFLLDPDLSTAITNVTSSTGPAVPCAVPTPPPLGITTP